MFTNILLADEINRTPPKTQSALLEAMEERQVSVDGQTRPLPVPFMVAATQNPIEYEGTYTLPEAQLDRFLLKLVLDIPERDAELEILLRTPPGSTRATSRRPGSRPVLDAEQIARGAGIRRHGDDEPGCARLHRRPRPGHPASPSVQLGVSPRGDDGAARGGEGVGVADGSAGVTPDHVQAMLLPVWRHRIQLRPEAELEGVSVDAVLRSILQQMQVPI